ncbi:MAG: hypothetical protein HQL81_10465, partial [Magnetococcales bacterium]|nr:hypothetical protein [Magnetococcales bacterium]
MTAFSILITLLSLVIIFIPVLGGYLTLIPGILTLLLPGRLHVMALVIAAINIINVLFMSPILRTNAIIGMERHDYKWVVIFMGLALFHGVAALVVHFRHARPTKTGEEKEHDISTEAASAHHPAFITLEEPGRSQVEAGSTNRPNAMTKERPPVPAPDTPPVTPLITAIPKPAAVQSGTAITVEEAPSNPVAAPSPP